MNNITQAKAAQCGLTRLTFLITFGIDLNEFMEVQSICDICRELDGD